MGEAEEGQKGGCREQVERKATDVGPQLQKLRLEIRGSGVSQQHPGRQIESLSLCWSVVGRNEVRSCSAPHGPSQE